jgi:hypothetical protein
MPMYLPLVTLAFFVSALAATVTGLLVPLLSGAVTGMPPLYPPVALCMAVEIAVMCWIISTLRRRLPLIRPLYVLAPVLLIGRVINVALTYELALALRLPAKFVAGLSLLAGWPGLLLMLLVVPVIVRVQSDITYGGPRRKG